MASSVFVSQWGPTPDFRAVSIEVAPGDAVMNNPAFPPALLIAGNLTQSGFIEVHNRYAVGADFYTHSDSAFRAPYINFYKSSGSQSAPTPVTLTGYELDSIGGINFGGWNGSAYVVGAAIYSQTDEDWNGSNHHGSHLSIYSSSIGSATQNQIMQFGGLDPADANAHNTSGVSSNIISFRAITFNGNSTSNVGMYPHSDALAPYLAIRKGNNGADAGLTCGTFAASGAATLSGGLVSYGANDSAGAGFRLVRVPNA